ncbi:MAG TPA: XRE family transcriptional regulator [Egibacteraceae bacterium]|nr:XRE family transcriptional regulator [Egibacteraceae bacterium]
MANLEERTRVALGRARQATGMTLTELAEQTDISTSTLSRLESGERRVTIDALERIATALGTTAAAVLADAAREDRLLLPTATVELAGGLTGAVLRVEDDGRSLLRISVPARRVTRTVVHPGTEWLHVLRGRLRLRVGERQVDMEAGQTAQFATTEPHAFGGIGGAAEILSRFEPGAHRA